MKKKLNGRITMADYVKAMKQANRELDLENSTGFKAVTKIHKSKKSYDRREGKKIDFDALPFLFFRKNISVNLDVLITLTKVC